MSYFIGFIKKFWLILFLLSSLLFILHYFIYQVGQLPEQIGFAWKILLITIFINVIYWVVATLIWKYLLLSVFGVNISGFQSFSQLVLVSMGKYIPGKIWGMVARGTQLRQFGLKMNSLVIVTVQEQILLLHASAVVSAIFMGLLMKTDWAWGLTGLALLSLLLGKHLQQIFFGLYEQLMKLLKRNFLLDDKPIITSFQYISLLGAYMMIWLLIGCVFGSLYFVFIAPNDFNLKIMLWMILANTVGTTIGFFAFFAPGGIGVRESVSSAILLIVIPLESAILISLLFRLWVVFTELTLGIIVGYILGKKSLQNLFYQR